MGAALDSGTVTIINSTLSGNTAEGGTGANGGSGFGGAVFNLDGDVTLLDDTLAGNFVQAGNALQNPNVVEPGNSGATAGGAVYNLAFGNNIDTALPVAAKLTLANSILANSETSGIPTNDLTNNSINGAGPNVAVVTATGPNLIMTNSATIGGIQPMTGVFPLLGPLQNNGGPTLTLAPLAGSPAIDAGNNSLAVDASGNPLATDQRGAGFARSQGAAVDLGAVETQPGLRNPTTIVVVGTPSAPVAGQPLTLSVLLASTQGGPAPMGNLTFKDGSTTLDVMSTQVFGIPTFTIPNLTAGDHAFSVSFDGGTNFEPVTSSVLYVFADPADPQGLLETTLTASSSTPLENVQNSSTPPNGEPAPPVNATFPEGFFQFTVPNVGVNGAATVTLTLPVGTTADSYDKFGATPDDSTPHWYAMPTFDPNNPTQPGVTIAGNQIVLHLIDGQLGDDDGAPNGQITDPGGPVVTLVPTMTQLTMSVYPASVGQAVTFTATVTSASGAPAQGVLQFSVDGSLMTTELTNGLATFSTSALTTGSHQILALYAGDDQFATSENMVTEVVNPASTTTLLTASANPTAAGQPVTFTATVTALPGESPDGTVAVSEDGNPLTTLTLSNGTASFTTSTLTAGAHQLEAVYSGSSSFDGSSSPVLPETVVPASRTGDIQIPLSPGDNAVINALGSDNGTIDVNSGQPIPFDQANSLTVTASGGSSTLTLDLPSGQELSLPGGVHYNGGLPGTGVFNIGAQNQAIVTHVGSLSTANSSTLITYSGVGTLNLENASTVDAIAGPDTVDRATAFAGLTAQERVVQALYLDELGRVGSKAELDGWTALFGAGATQAPTFVIAAIQHSFEAQDRLVKAWYLTYLGRPALNGEENSWVNLLQTGQTEEQVLSQLLGEPEFYARAQTLVSTGTADQRYVQALFQVLLGRTGLPTEVASWVSVFSVVQGGRQGVALAFLQSIEFRTDQFEGYYNALLHRPTTPTDNLPALVLSGLDMATVRIEVEASAEFYTNG